MKTRMRMWVLFFIIIGMIIMVSTNCNKKEDPDPEPPNSTITVDKPIVNQFEVAYLTPANITFNQTEYLGNIAGQTVNIVLSGQKLLFLVPEISPGEQKLTTTIEGIDYSINLTINQAAVIENPAVFVNGMFHDLNLTIGSIGSRIDTLVKYGLINGTDEKLFLQVVKDSLTFYNEQFLLLSSENQAYAAKVLHENMKGLSIVRDSLSPLLSEMYGQGLKKQNTLCEQEERSWRMLCLMTKYNNLKGTINITAELNTLLGLLTLPLPGWAKLPFNILNASWASVEDQYFILGFELGSRPYHPMEIIFLNPPVNFINFEPKSISLTIKVRNAKENPDEADKYWEKDFSSNMKDQINSWNNGLFDFLSGRIIIRRFPVLIQPHLLPERSDLLTAQITENNDVFNIPIQSANNDLYLKFGTNKVGSQDFAYNIKYDDFTFELTTFDWPSKLITTEPYSISIFSGNNQTGQAGQTLANPLQVMVVDQEGNPFSEVKVNFAANNGGSVSQSQAITDDNGIASVIWTLGGTDNTQTVNVTAFQSDDITPLQGSPLVFTATTTMAGTDIIEIFGGNFQTGFWGQTLSLPITVFVTDNSGNQIPGVKVNFVANNNGSVSQSQVITDMYGMSSVNWTLGDTDYTQTVTVTAFQNDEITPLQGSPLTFTATIRFNIGQNYGGGIVYHLDASKQHGLIAAPADQDTASWGCYLTLIGGTSCDMGTGMENTIAIVNGCSDSHIAARICNDLVLNGFSDWYLPSRDEARDMYPYQYIIGGFNYYFYWTSSEYDARRAEVLFLLGGDFGQLNKNAHPSTGIGVRAVRSF
jgi:hypothetical protein